MITCCCCRRGWTLILTRCSSVRHFEYFNQNRPVDKPSLAPAPLPPPALHASSLLSAPSRSLLSPGARQGAREAVPLEEPHPFGRSAHAPPGRCGSSVAKAPSTCQSPLRFFFPSGLCTCATFSARLKSSPRMRYFPLAASRCVICEG